MGTGYKDTMRGSEKMRRLGETVRDNERQKEYQDTRIHSFFYKKNLIRNKGLFFQKVKKKIKKNV